RRVSRRAKNLQLVGPIFIRLAAGDRPAELPVALAIAKRKVFSCRQSLLPPDAGGEAHHQRRDQNRGQSPAGMQPEKHSYAPSAQCARKMASDGTTRWAEGSSGRPLAILSTRQPIGRSDINLPRRSL